MFGVLVTQHSRWIAMRIHSAHVGQSWIDFGGDSWTCLSTQSTGSKISNRREDKARAKQTHILSNFTRQFIPSQETVVSLEESACCSEHDVLEHDVSDDESTLSSEKARAKLDFSPEQLRNPFIRFKKG